MDRIKRGLNAAENVTIVANPNAPMSRRVLSGFNTANDTANIFGYGTGPMGGLLSMAAKGLTLAGDAPLESKVGAGAGMAAAAGKGLSSAGALPSTVGAAATKALPIVGGGLAIYDMIDKGPSGTNIGGLLSAGAALAGAGALSLIPATAGFIADKLGLFGDGNERAHVERTWNWQYDPNKGWVNWTRTDRHENGTPVKAKDLVKADDEMVNTLTTVIDQFTDQLESLAPGFKDSIAGKDFQTESYWGVETKKEFKKRAKNNSKRFSTEILAPIGWEFNRYFQEHPEGRARLKRLTKGDFKGYLDPETNLVFDEYYGVIGQVDPSSQKFVPLNWYLKPEDYKDADIDV